MAAYPSGGDIVLKNRGIQSPKSDRSHHVLAYSERYHGVVTSEQVSVFRRLAAPDCFGEPSEAKREALVAGKSLRLDARRRLHPGHYTAPYGEGKGSIFWATPIVAFLHTEGESVSLRLECRVIMTMYNCHATATEYSNV